MLPEVARKAAEDVATLIIAAGCFVPGTTRPRQPEPPARGGGGRGSGSRAHPGRQVSRPARADRDANRDRLSGTVPAKRRNAHMMAQSAAGHPAIPRPTSAHTGTLTTERPGVKPQVRTGAPPGTRTPNPRIKSPLLSSILLFRQVSYGSVRCRDVPFPAGRRTATVSARTGSCRVYRDFRANMGTGRSRPLRKMITIAGGRTAPSGPEFWHGKPLLC